jgi:hypothetical protein
MLYYAITHNEVWDLGQHPSIERADFHAVDQFNMHMAPSGYVVVNFRELEAIKNILDRRLLRRKRGRQRLISVKAKTVKSTVTQTKSCLRVIW